MDFQSFWKIATKKKTNIFLIISLFIIVSAGLSFVQPLKYKSESEILMVQNLESINPYNMAKANNYLSRLFAQVITSESFYDQVMASDYDINKEYFRGSLNETRKKWVNTVEPEILSDTGILKINVYHPNPAQAKEISLAINDVLKNKNFKYQLNDRLTEVKIINKPLVSEYPVEPNILLNLSLALLLGVLVSFFYINYLQAQGESYNSNQDEPKPKSKPEIPKREKVETKAAPNTTSQIKREVESKNSKDQPKEKSGSNLDSNFTSEDKISSNTESESASKPNPEIELDKKSEELEEGEEVDFTGESEQDIEKRASMDNVL